jgi:hypothetical protein
MPDATPSPAAPFPAPISAPAAAPAPTPPPAPAVIPGAAAAPAPIIAQAAPTSVAPPFQSPAPTSVSPAFVAPAKTDAVSDLSKATLPGKPTPDFSAPKPRENPSVANLPQPISAPPKPAPAVPAATPYRFAGFGADKLDEGKFIEAVTQAQKEFATATPTLGQPVAHPGLAEHGWLQGIDAKTGNVKVMFPQAKFNPSLAVEYPIADLFDPVRALAIYRQLTAPAPTSGVGSSKAAAIAALILLAGIATVLMSACTDFSLSSVASSAMASAHLGSLLKVAETPAAVQTEAQVVTAEVLQRAVATKNQATVAGWCSCISRAFMDLAGQSAPSSADLQAAIQKETGPVTNPEFPIVLATATDLWNAVQGNIPADSTPAKVEQYLYAVSTGIQNAATGYLPASTATVNYIVLRRMHHEAQMSLSKNR